MEAAGVGAAKGSGVVMAGASGVDEGAAGQVGVGAGGRSAGCGAVGVNGWSAD